jgi:predicted nucleic acid-binding protein
MSAFLLDTSFLITFSVPSRPHHDAANRYFLEALQRRIPLHVSTISLAEFSQKQSVSDLPMRNFWVVPFNIDHAIKTGELMEKLRRDEGDDRAKFKDDIKLIAQASCESIPFVLTEDQNTFAKYTTRLNALGSIQTKPVLLADGYQDSWFNGGQSSIDFKPDS